MDTNEQTITNEQQEAKLELTENSVNNLNQLRKWTMFFSVIGFIFTGLILVLVAFLFIFSSNFPMVGNKLGYGFLVIIGFVYLTIAIMYFFPVLFLYKFSSNSKKAFKTKNSLDLENAFKNLNSHYTLTGIYTIIFIGIYVLVILGVVVFRLSIGKF